MEVIAKKISKKNTGSSTKLSKGSFFKPALTLVPQIQVNNKPTFFKAANQIPKSTDNGKVTDPSVITNKVNTESAAVALNKPAEIIPTANQPALEKDSQQNSQAAGNNQEQAVNSSSNISINENDVAAVPVNKSNGIQVDEKAAPAPDGKNAVAEAKPGLLFINAAATEKIFQGKIKKAGELAKGTATTKTPKQKIDLALKLKDQSWPAA